MIDKNTAFTDQELAILQSLVNRAHTNNTMSGMGNSAPMTDLYRKLNVLTGNEGANDE